MLAEHPPSVPGLQRGVRIFCSEGALIGFSALNFSGIRVQNMNGGVVSPAHTATHGEGLCNRRQGRCASARHPLQALVQMAAGGFCSAPACRLRRVRTPPHTAQSPFNRQKLLRSQRWNERAHTRGMLLVRRDTVAECMCCTLNRWQGCACPRGPQLTRETDSATFVSHPAAGRTRARATPTARAALTCCPRSHGRCQSRTAAA